MSLSNFFSINMPYGLKRTSNNEWVAFNREYHPLGYNTTNIMPSIYNDNCFLDLPLYTKYKDLTEEIIRKHIRTEDINVDKNGNIQLVFFYSDSTDPSSPDAKASDWDNYFRIIKFITKFQREV